MIDKAKMTAIVSRIKRRTRLNLVSRKAARAFLIESGIYQPDGSLSKEYGGQETEEQHMSTATAADMKSEREAAAGRLREAMEGVGLNAFSAAKRFGWNVNTFKKHESGENAFGVADARRYARAFSVSPAWLLLGDGTEDVPVAAVADDLPEPQFPLGEIGKKKYLELVKMLGDNLNDVTRMQAEVAAAYFEKIHRAIGLGTEMSAHDGMMLQRALDALVGKKVHKEPPFSRRVDAFLIKDGQVVVYLDEGEAMEAARGTGRPMEPVSVQMPSEDYHFQAE